MQILSQMTREDLIDILDQRAGTCVSILLPTHPDQFERHQADILQLKNLLRDAEKQLAAFDPDLRVPDIADILKPATTLLHHSHGFWRRAGAGVVIYLTADWHFIARLPLRFVPQVSVGRDFFIRPLVPLLTGHGRYFILGLCQNDVCLFEATQDSIERVPLTGMPTSLKLALAYDDPQKQSQFHTGTAPASASGRRDAIFFGHGTVESSRKDELLRFCQQIDAGLQPLLRHESAPLLVACVDYLLPIYREANSYAHLLDVHLSGNPALLGEAALQQMTWPLVQPEFNRAQQQALEQYGHALGAQRATAVIEPIVIAAHHGRVDTLFTAADRSAWGHYNPAAGQVVTHAAPKPGDEDLVNTAVGYTLHAGGDVYVLPPEEMPDDSAMAAIYRY